MGITLPWPPTANTYWRKRHGQQSNYISAEGKAYREQVRWLALRHGKFGDARLAVTIDLYPPDRRRRDIDNVLKALLDALEAAGIYDNDSQIDRLIVSRHEMRKGGAVKVVLSVIG